MTRVRSKSDSSLWEVNQWPENNGDLASSLQCDVCIIGAGIAGISTGYFLAKEGRKVVIVDACRPASGETGNTTAHLASALDDRFYKLEKLFGEDGARLAAESHRKAIDKIEEICQQEKINCFFERLDGYLFAPSLANNDEIDKEFEAAKRAGFEKLTRLSHAPFPSFKTGACIKFPEQGQFHPLIYLKGLLKAFCREGGKYFSNCEISEIQEGESVRVMTRDGFIIRAEHVVCATNTPINDIVTMHTKQHSYRSYVIAAEIDKAAVPKGLFWDTLEQYHYVRTQEFSDGKTLLLVGGEDHKTAQGPTIVSPFENLESWMRTRFPQAKHLVRRWSGQVIEPVDGLAFIGVNPGSRSNIYIATGDSGHGMTHGTIAGMLLTDLIQGRESPWQDLYDPSRKNIHLDAVNRFIRENLNVAFQYTDYLTFGETSKLEDIPLGEGAVLRRGLRKVAVYHDTDGSFVELSAVCTHLNGVVHWNKMEKTWDCPCHGARFDCHGNVMNGPAVENLATVETTEDVMT